MQYNNMLISVVITTKNAMEFIELCIQAIKNQTYKNIEIIVVDNFSKDGTDKKAKELQAKVYSKGPERSAQRNYGAEVASGEYVVFADVDMIFTERFIEEIVDIVSNDPDVVGIYMHQKIRVNSFFNKARDFEESFYRKTVIDCARIINRKKFLEIGGFDLTLNGPEDFDLDRRVRAIGKVAYMNEIYNHHENQTLWQYLRRKSYYSTSFEAYFKKWGFDEITKKQFGLFYRYFGVFTENGKWKIFFRHPILAIYIYFYKSMVGLVFLLSKFNISKRKNDYDR